MLKEGNQDSRFYTKRAWIQGKANNLAQIPVEVARIETLLFIMDKLAYKVEYESGHIGYIFLSEIDQCEIFQIESKIKS